MAWKTVTEVAKIMNVNPNQIHSVRLQGTVPNWMEMRGKRWFVDEHSNKLRLHLLGKKKKAETASKGHRRKKRKSELEKSKEIALSNSETERLQELSIQADLSQPIVKLQLQKYKIESEKLQLAQNSGNLVERELAEFLYTGYLDRLNRELLQYANKIENNVELLIIELLLKAKHDQEIVPKIEAKKITKMIKDETEDIIRGVKKSQIDEVKKWAKENGVKL